MGTAGFLLSAERGPRPVSIVPNVINNGDLNPLHARALVNPLDACASDPAGGGKPLPEFLKVNLMRELASRPQALGVATFAGAHIGAADDC
jgi:hypothetical protein